MSGILKLGTTTLPLAGWIADPQRPADSQRHRLAAMRQVVEGYGLSAVELTLDLAAAFPQVFDASFYAAVAGLQQELGFACTAHLPFLWVDLASLNQPIRQASLACLRRAVELTRPVDIQTYVLHLWGFTTTQIAVQLQRPVHRQVILEALMQQAGRSITELCEILEPRDLCVENLEDSLFDLALPLIEQHDTSICLDVGHLAWHGVSELEFLMLHADRIREIHLHDAASRPEGTHRQVRDHLALGQGQIDFDAFLAKLEEMGYDGTVILEFNSREALETSLRAIRSHL